MKRTDGEGGKWGYVKRGDREERQRGRRRVDGGVVATNEPQTWKRASERAGGSELGGRAVHVAGITSPPFHTPSTCVSVPALRGHFRGCDTNELV